MGGTTVKPWNNSENNVIYSDAVLTVIYMIYGGVIGEINTREMLHDTISNFGMRNGNFVAQ